MTRPRRLGVMFRREWAPELLPDVARRVEHNGFDELWVVEDLGYHGGFTQATAALAATDELHVGLGIAPAAVRNVAYASMEVATLARLFPGRFHMGYGHGVERWMAQVGATPGSWITASTRSPAPPPSCSTADRSASTATTCTSTVSNWCTRRSTGRPSRSV